MVWSYATVETFLDHADDVQSLADTVKEMASCITTAHNVKPKRIPIRIPLFRTAQQIGVNFWEQINSRVSGRPSSTVDA